jgi:hypothetical protein
MKLQGGYRNAGRAHFVNFRAGDRAVIASVTEVVASKSIVSQCKKWNNWEIGQELNDSVLWPVQSVIGFFEMIICFRYKVR